MILTPLIVCTLVEPAGHGTLEAGCLGSQTGVPGDPPLFPHPILHTISSGMAGGIGGRASSCGLLLIMEAARAFRMMPEKLSTHVSFAPRAIPD